MEKKQIKRMIGRIVTIALPISLFIVYVCTKDTLFLALVSIDLAALVLIEEINKLKKRIKHLETKR